MKQKLIIAFLCLAVVAPLGLALAQNPPVPSEAPTGAEETNFTSIEAAQAVMQRIVGWAQVFFYIIATLFIILAAFRYLTSGGDDEKVNAAKNMLIYSIVAIAIASVAGGVVLLVRRFINEDISTTMHRPLNVNLT